MPELNSYIKCQLIFGFFYFILICLVKKWNCCESAYDFPAIGDLPLWLISGFILWTPNLEVLFVNLFIFESGMEFKTWGWSSKFWFFENFVQGSYNYNILRDLLGDGIFTVDDEKWRQQRKVSSYEFSTKVLRDFSSVVFRKNGAKLAKVVSEAARSNRTMDIQVRLFTWCRIHI